MEGSSVAPSDVLSFSAACRQEAATNNARSRDALLNDLKIFFILNSSSNGDNYCFSGCSEGFCIQAFGSNQLNAVVVPWAALVYDAGFVHCMYVFGSMKL